MDTLRNLRMYTQSIDHYFHSWSNGTNTRRKQTKDNKVDRTFDSILQEKLELLDRNKM